MLIKENVQQIIEKMPANFSVDDLLDELFFMEKVHRGLEQSKKGETISHEEAKQKMQKWLK